MALVCKKANITSEDWHECLLQVDKYILDSLFVRSDKVIIISTPYSLTDTKQALSQFISNAFTEESMLFCCDMIMEFIIASKHYIHYQISKNNKAVKKIDIAQESLWTNEKYDKLLATQSLIIINTATLQFISLPRDVKDLRLFSCSRISWDDGNGSNSEYGQICFNIFTNTKSECIENHFHVETEDYSIKTDFSGVRLIGYLCDNGEIVEGDCLTQNPSNGKIFVHFNTDAPHFGKKYEWFETPNGKVCFPPKHRPKQKAFKMATYYSKQGGSKINVYETSDDNQYETDLQRAIQASLQDQTNNGVKE